MAATQNSWSALPQSVRDAARIPVLEAAEYRCQIRGPNCAGRATDVDHIVPRKDHGSLLDPNNLRAACPPCNRGRRDDRKPPATAAVRPPSREW